MWHKKRLSEDARPRQAIRHMGNMRTQCERTNRRANTHTMLRHSRGAGSVYTQSLGYFHAREAAGSRRQPHGNVIWRRAPELHRGGGRRPAPVAENGASGVSAGRQTRHSLLCSLVRRIPGNLSAAPVGGASVVFAPSWS